MQARLKRAGRGKGYCAQAAAARVGNITTAAAPGGLIGRRLRASKCTRVDSRDRSRKGEPNLTASIGVSGRQKG
jgi:hypothetical protein